MMKLVRLVSWAAVIAPALVALAMENGISVLKARPSSSYCLTISVMPLADTLKESPADSMDSPIKSIRSVKIPPTFDAVFSAAPVSSRTSAARVRMSMSSYAIYRKVLVYSKGKLTKGKKKRQKESVLFPSWARCSRLADIWCGWAGNGKSTLKLVYLYQSL